jgi:hypothetical protein
MRPGPARRPRVAGDVEVRVSCADGGAHQRLSGHAAAPRYGMRRGWGPLRLRRVPASGSQPGGVPRRRVGRANRRMLLPDGRPATGPHLHVRLPHVRVWIAQPLGVQHGGLLLRGSMAGDDTRSGRAAVRPCAAQCVPRLAPVDPGHAVHAARARLRLRRRAVRMQQRSCAAIGDDVAMHGPRASRSGMRAAASPRHAMRRGGPSLHLWRLRHSRRRRRGLREEYVADRKPELRPSARRVRPDRDLPCQSTGGRDVLLYGYGLRVRVEPCRDVRHDGHVRGGSDHVVGGDGARRGRRVLRRGIAQPMSPILRGGAPRYGLRRQPIGMRLRRGPLSLLDGTGGPCVLDGGMVMPGSAGRLPETSSEPGDSMRGGGARVPVRTLRS